MQQDSKFSGGLGETSKKALQGGHSPEIVSPNDHGNANHLGVVHSELFNSEAEVAIK